MLLKKIKKIKGFSVLIVPDDGSHGTRTKKLTRTKLIIIVALYTLAVFVLSGLLIAYTPLNSMLAPTSSNLSSADIKRIEDLNNKMIFLTKELESLKSTNERLRYAIILGDSSLADTLQAKKNDKEENKLKKSGGNIFAVVKDLFFAEKDSVNRGPNIFNSKIKEEPLYYFYNPVNGYISREFYPEKGHFGVDYVLKTGTPVYAAAGGYIVFADYTTKDGYMIIINHSNDYITVYKHCSSLIKREREIVVQGDLIALSGNTGTESFGPHLHFELWKNGKPINPKELLIK